MKNIYQESIQAVENGTKFKVDLKHEVSNLMANILYRIRSMRET